jgi:hypothetical protein
MYQVPKIDLNIATNLSLISGQPYGSQVQVSLPQGRQSVFVEQQGTYYTPNQEYLMLRFTKNIRWQANRLELMVELRNLFNETSDGAVANTILGASNFGQPNVWAWPRRMYLGARYFFR